MKTGIVFNIQRYTLHDGPGIRTEIFLKGCPLRCPWCSNPESHSLYPEPAVYPGRCLSKEICGACVKACPFSDCLRFDDGDRIAEIDREECMRCSLCEKACPSEAIRFFGRKMNSAEVMDLILRDREYYLSSGGGVTISGGEPLVQSAFAFEILDLCKEEGIHTCLESTFYAEEETAMAAAAKADLLISDLKLMDGEKHRKYTGVENGRILSNIRKIAETERPLILRIPLIPGVNTDRENLEKTAEYILEDLGNRIEALELLPFMHMGEEKCRSLGRPYPMAGLEIDREAFHKEVMRDVAFFRKKGINCRTGGRSGGK